MKNRHKHADKIIAKAENMGLVVFTNNGNEWERVYAQFPMWSGSKEYFLCLPKHEKECLQWLNGGIVQAKNGCDWLDACVSALTVWNANSIFMNEALQIRIKPKKEKRWIAVDANSRKISFLDDSPEEIKRTGSSQNWQFIEIEVEVKQ